MSKPSVKKTGPTVHTYRPTVHPVGSRIDFIDVTKFRKPFKVFGGQRERDRGPQSVQDMKIDRANEKRANRRARRLNEQEKGGWGG